MSGLKLFLRFSSFKRCRKWPTLATADFMVALVVTEELEEHNQMMVKQLKNRYNDPTKFKRFIIGVDRERMKLFDVEDVAQEDLFENETSGNGVVLSTQKEGLNFEGFEV